MAKLARMPHIGLPLLWPRRSSPRPRIFPRRRPRPPGPQEAGVVGLFLDSTEPPAHPRPPGQARPAELRHGDRRRGGDGHRLSRSRIASPPRPLTHDLFLTLFGRLKVTVTRVVITDLKDGIYYATVVLDAGGTEMQLDSRPSDAIALAIRAKAPVLVEDRVFDKSDLLPGPAPGAAHLAHGSGRGAAAPAAGGRREARQPAVGHPAPHRRRLRQARGEVRRPDRARGGPDQARDHLRPDRGPARGQEHRAELRDGAHRPGALPQVGHHAAQGRAALRPAGHRQVAARPRAGHRDGCGLLPPQADEPDVQVRPEHGRAAPGDPDRREGAGQGRALSRRGQRAVARAPAATRAGARGLGAPRGGALREARRPRRLLADDRRRLDEPHRLRSTPHWSPRAVSIAWSR